MLYKLTSIYKQNAQALLGGFRRALNEGGTSSSKTVSILQILILVAQHTKENLLISVVSESLPHLKRGCIRDFQKILGEWFDDNKYNKTEHVYDFGKGKIEFFPLMSLEDGGVRDILFINECNNVSYDAFKSLTSEPGCLLS